MILLNILNFLTWTISFIRSTSSFGDDFYELFLGINKENLCFIFERAKFKKKTLKSLSFLYLLYNIPKRFFQNFQEKNWKMDFKSMFFCGKFSPFGKIIFQTNNDFLI